VNYLRVEIVFPRCKVLGRRYFPIGVGREICVFHSSITPQVTCKATFDLQMKLFLNTKKIRSLEFDRSTSFSQGSF